MNGRLFDESKWKQLRPLRPRQSAAIEAIRQAVRQGHKRIVVQAPCGFGKTLTAAHLIESSVQKGKRSLFTCPAITLVDQTLAAFEEDGIRDIGVIQAQHERTDWRAQVQIASVQTLIRRALPEVDFILIDECHLQWAKLYERLESEEWKSKIVIGLSATPWAKGMGLRWTSLIVAASTSELEAEGFSAPVTVYVPPDRFKPDVSKLKTVAGDYEERAASAVMSDRMLVGHVVDTWLRLGPGEKTFMFGIDRAHAQLVQKEFQDAGVACGYIDNETSADDRKLIFQRYRRGDLKIIASVGCLILGVDEDVRCLIDACLTKSVMRYVQVDGRLRRTAEGKECGIKLDHAGNTLRLGRIEDIRISHLDTSKPGEKADLFNEAEKPPKKPRECGVCHAVIPVGQRQCGACGAIECGVETIEGELIEFGSKPKPEPKEKHTMSDKQEFWSEILAMGQEQGRQRGWCSHKYQDKFGVWPKGLMDLPKEPSQQVRSWVKSQNIRYAKSMEKKNAQAV